MQKRNLLDGEVWFAVHLTFSAIMSLACFILENDKAPEIDEVVRDAELGRDALIALSRHSLWAGRCLRTLKV